VRDNYGNLIEPFSEENCDPFTSDSVEHTVTWKGNPTIPVRDWRRLAFTIAGAELFSFHFAGSQ
jgi:hypothetical protein